MSEHKENRSLRAGVRKPAELHVKDNVRDIECKLIDQNPVAAKRPGIAWRPGVDVKRGWFGFSLGGTNQEGFIFDEFEKVAMDKFVISGKTFLWRNRRTGPDSPEVSGQDGPAFQQSENRRYGAPLEILLFECLQGPQSGQEERKKSSTTGLFSSRLSSRKLLG